MQKPEYKRDMYENYMILREQGEEEKEGYTMKMVANNHIPGLLDVEIRTVDQKREYYYNITAKQPITVFFQKRMLGEKEIKEILVSIISTLREGREYLLWEEGFLLNPAYIYIDLKSFQTKLVYFSGYGESIWEQFLKLIEYMMDRIDYRDKSAVFLIYGIYKMSREESCTMDRLLEFLQEEGALEEELMKQEKEEEELFQEAKRTEFMEIEVEEEEEKKKYPIWIWGGCLASVAGAFALIFLAARYGIIFEEATGRLIPVRMAAVLGVIGALEAYCLLRLLNEKNQIAYIDKKIDYVKPLELVGGRAEEPTIEETSLLAEEMEQATVLLAERIGEYVLIPKKPDEYAPIFIPEFPFFIGTLQTKVDCVINSRKVSRFHAKLEKEEGTFYLADLNSTNGTFLNGVRLAANGRKELLPGDLVSFADVAYSFENEMA